MELIIIRHGQTPGNAERKYVGIVDQPLSEQGRAEARAVGEHANVRRVYVSTLQRTHETADIMFPNAEQIVVDGIQEMDFGVFAGRSANEMEGDPEYRAWVDSMCTLPCPDGESQDQLVERVSAAMEQLLRRASDRGEQRVIVVGHGGTMMGAMSRFVVGDDRAYWEWLVGNCNGYRMDVEIAEDDLRFTNVELLDFDLL